MLFRLRAFHFRLYKQARNLFLIIIFANPNLHVKYPSPSNQFFESSFKTTCTNVMKKIFMYLPAVLFTITTAAQTSQEKLTAEILHLDSAFWNTYNNCDTTAFKNYFTDDVEFYHDKGGVTTTAASLVESLNKNLCGNSNYRLRREAVAGTVNVYPMQKGNEIYGAVISGEHLFYITTDGKPEFLDGQALFMDLWLLKNGTWKMARIISYNHHPAEYQEIEAPPEKLDALTGSYLSPQFGAVSVERKDSILLLKAGNETYNLYPKSYTEFFTKGRDLVFKFVMSSSKPEKIMVYEHGVVADEVIYQK